MKTKLSSILVFAVLFFATAIASDQIPNDLDIITGKLDNGLTYFLKVNGKPANRAELRLAVKVGSVDEAEHERGLAHFLEHMSFNGTTKYPKSDLVDYLESLGMGFGPDLNAYTSFDETVYMIQIPTDEPEKFSSGVEILSQWAGYLTLDGEEIDKERGVIVEEWRGGRGASQRIFDEQFPVLMEGSKYSERLPIGLMDVVENASYETLRDFYRRLYRPDQMGVMVVGDFDPIEVEGWIKQYFGEIPSRTAAPTTEDYPVPDHKEIRVVISTDPEATRSSATITIKQDVESTKTLDDYRRDLKHRMLYDLLSQRLEEQIRSAEPPFVYGTAFYSQYVDTKGFSTLYASTESDGILAGIAGLITELQRARIHGFLASELDRAKERHLARMEELYANRNKQESRRIVRGMVQRFLEGNPSPGIAWEFSAVQELLPAIEIEDINALIPVLYPDHSMVVQISLPEDDSIAVPTKEDVLSLIDAVERAPVAAYEDDTSDRPLLESIPTPGGIDSEWYYPELDLHDWQLSNGLRILAKSTPFKDDQIIFNGYAPGGASLFPAQEYHTGLLTANVINEAGMGSFSLTQLEKILAGKRVEVVPYVQDHYQGFRGKSTVGDLETTMQLIYGMWTQPRFDADSFNNLMERYRAYVANSSNNPEHQWGVLVDKTNSSGHYTSLPWSSEIIDRIEHQNTWDNYQLLFGNPDAFTFIFVGSFDLDTLRELVQTYLASLPARHHQTMTYQDMDVEFPRRPVSAELFMGQEEKSATQITFYHYMPKSFTSLFYLKATTDILEVRLRKLLREDMGATYHVYSGTSNQRPAVEFSQAFIAFHSSPDNVPEMVDIVFQEIQKLKADPPSDEEVNNIIEKYLNQRETNLEDNRYWLNSLRACNQWGIEPGDILTRNNRIQSLTPRTIQKTVKKYYNSKRHTIVTMYPEADQSTPGN